VINVNRQVRDMFCLGASAGGLQAVIDILARLPDELPAVIALAMHRSPTFDSQLVALLSNKTSLPVMEPFDGDPISAGHVYVAPRDMHLTVSGDRWRLVRGAKVHWTRPAVDPLFVTAAERFGHRCVGVLLSGGGGDGVAGLIAIKAKGGLSIAQNPAEAQHPSMPVRAIHGDDVDAVLSTGEIAVALTALAHGAALPTSSTRRSDSLIPTDF
jgi:two-component system, chemotaxis family, protein-glutamate methylesterase/glutaminase